MHGPVGRLFAGQGNGNTNSNHRSAAQRSTAENETNGERQAGSEALQSRRSASEKKRPPSLRGVVYAQSAAEHSVFPCFSASRVTLRVFAISFSHRYSSSSSSSSSMVSAYCGSHRRTMALPRRSAMPPHARAACHVPQCRPSPAHDRARAAEGERAHHSAAQRTSRWPAKTQGSLALARRAHLSCQAETTRRDAT